MAEAVMTGAVSGGIVEIGKWACKLTKRHIEYLFCYRQKVDELKEKISKELVPTKADIEEQLEAAERRGGTVTNEAEQWRKDFQEVERLNKENVDGAAAAPCFCWGYRFAKKAAHGLVVADQLRKRAAGLVLFHPARTPAVEVRLPIDGFQELGTTASCMESVMKKLRDGSPGLIGVHGMGGVGKSFLVKKVLRRAQSEGLFKEVVFAVVSEDVNVKMIQQQIAEVFDVNVTQMSDSKGAAVVRERLMNSKGGVLIVLDDLWQALDTSLVGIPTEVAGGGANYNYKVVITTRDKDVCARMGCNEFVPLTTLSEDESWELFRITAGVDDTSGPGIIEMARSAARKCGGLPLALTVLGKTTRGYRKAEEWRSVVEELDELRPIKMEGVRDDLYQVVKVSFDRLRSEEERLCFLFLCLFPEDYCVSLINRHYHPHEYTRAFEIRLPTYAWYAVGEGFLENWDTLADAQKRVGNILLRLKDCGLLIDGDIKDEDGEEYYGSVKMHDVVRHVALQIAAGDGYGLYSKAGVALQQWPITISNLDLIQRISLVSARCKNDDDYYYRLGLLPNDMDCPRLRTLTLAHSRILKYIPDDFFFKMKALQVLDLNMDSVSSFPSSLSSLTNLRVLFLSGGYRYNDTDLFIISSLTNLVILGIRGGTISLFPKEMGNLSRLRCLDLTACEVLIMPPNVLSKLSNLEQLYMTHSFDQWHVQQDTARAAFVELARLRHLTHLHVNVENKECLLQEFDSVDPWPNLTEFHIHPPRYPQSYPINYAIQFTTTNIWLDMRVDYNALLWPGWLKRLMTRTKQLFLFGLGTLEIPASNFSLVQNLFIQGTSNPSMLFNAGGSFTNLKRLDVYDCRNITSIFASDTLLPKVEMIELRGLPQLTRICQEGDLRCPNLTELIVRDCSSLTHILACQRDGVLCPNLTELTVRDCSSLTAIVATSEELEEEDEATLLQQQDNSFLPRLQKLRLRSLPLLIKFPRAGNINNRTTPPVFIPSLQRIIVEDCPQLEAQHLGPESLTNISIRSSSNLWNSLSLSDFFSRAPLLEYLELIGIEELYEIFFGIGIHAPPMLSALTTMSNCDGGDIPYGSFQNLIRLDINNCKSLRHVLSPALDPNCQLGLQVLQVYECDLLTSIFSKRQAAQCLPQLKRLYIISCAALRELIMFEEEVEEDNETASGISILPRLEEITIEGCPNLEKALVPELLPYLENLKSIRISDCPKLRVDYCLLPKVERIYLKSLPQLTRICQEGDLRCPNLTDLTVKNCNSLTHIFPSWRQIQCLEDLSLKNCRALTAIIATSEELEEEDEATLLQRQDNSFLPRLQNLTLTDLPLLTKFHQAGHINNNSTPPVFIPSLQILSVRGCPQLEALHLGPESLTGIIIINSGNLYNNLSLSSDFFSRVPLLRNLELELIEELYEIFFGMGVHAPPMLPALTEMRLESLPQLISIFAGGDIPYWSFRKLYKLEIINCNSMSIFLSKRQPAQCLPQLEELSIERCAALRELIMFEEEEEEDDEKAAEISMLPRLERITITGCPNLEKALVPKLLPHLKNLQSIHISDCQKLRQVLDCNSRFQGQNPLLPWLRSIELSNLPQLTSIWYGDVPNGILRSLKKVYIKRCDQLSNLFTWRQARCLQQLMKLQLTGCSALKDVITPMHVDEGEITDDSLLPQREEFTPSILLPALQDVKVSECPLLKTFAIRA